MKNLMLKFLTLISFLIAGFIPSLSSAQEQKSISAILAQKGVQASIEWLHEQPQNSQNQFLLGGLEVLSAFEYLLQVRYQNYSGELPLFPGGTVSLDENPDAVFDPAFVEIALMGALERLARSQTYLDEIAGQSFFANLNPFLIWLDINSNGRRDDNEDLMDMIGSLPGLSMGADSDFNVRFDSADANWLLAYVHVLSGMSELLLALDPTTAITTITEGRKLLEDAGKILPDPIFGGGADEFMDTAAIILMAFRGVPDNTRTRASLTHFRAMITHNQEFWRQVMLETDDEREWLPNPDQKSAFGVRVNLKIATAWQGVLAEISDVLEGRVLLPHWRVGSRNAKTGVGINFARLMSDPGDFDLILMIHGAAIAPYLETGRIVDEQVWQEFSELTGGQGGLFSLWLN